MKKNCLYCRYSVVEDIFGELTCSKTNELLFQDGFLSWPEALKCPDYEEEIIQYSGVERRLKEVEENLKEVKKGLKEVKKGLEGG